MMGSWDGFLTFSPICPTPAAAAQVDLALRVTFTLEAAVQVGAAAWCHLALAALFDFDVRQVLLESMFNWLLIALCR